MHWKKAGANRLGSACAIADTAALRGNSATVVVVALFFDKYKSTPLHKQPDLNDVRICPHARETIIILKELCYRLFLSRKRQGILTSFRHETIRLETKGQDV